MIQTELISKRVDGKIVVVTGGSSGIGLAPDCHPHDDDIVENEDLIKRINQFIIGFKDKSLYCGREPFLALLEEADLLTINN